MRVCLLLVCDEGPFLVCAVLRAFHDNKASVRGRELKAEVCCARQRLLKRVVSPLLRRIAAAALHHGLAAGGCDTEVVDGPELAGLGEHPLLRKRIKESQNPRATTVTLPT